MKRMTLLTSLIMVFSLITATAAIAGTGAKAGEGSQNTDTVMPQTQERTRAQEQVQEPSCQAGDPAFACEPLQARTQAREELQVRNPDSECLGTDKECAADQEQAPERDRDQIRSNDDACVGTGAECEQLRETHRAEIQERIMMRLAVFADGSGEGEYLRVLTRRVLAYINGPISALFT